MPYYYDLNRPITTNGTPATETEHLRLLSVANQALARVMAVYIQMRGSVAGGVIIRPKTFGTAGSGGTAQTPAKKNPNDRAADTTAFNDATALTAGTTITVRTGIGAPQTGGQGGYMPPEADAAYTLQPNGGANGNMEYYSIANAASQLGDLNLELKEG